MRWYCVLCLRASFLKNSTLRLLREIVTFTPSSRNTRSSGFGRKSGTTLTSPRGWSEYLIFSLIDSFSFAPISCAVDFDAIVKCEDEIRPTRPRRSLVRTGLAFERPADPVESCEYPSGLGRRPRTHAAAMPMEMGCALVSL